MAVLVKLQMLLTLADVLRLAGDRHTHLLFLEFKLIELKHDEQYF